MDNTQLEKLMDRYRRELIEFSKMNGGMNRADMTNPNGFEPDERERKQQAAQNGTQSYERDRSDPLPTVKDEEPRALEAQASVQPQESESEQEQASYRERSVAATGSTDIPRLLRESCEALANEPRATDEKRRRCREINEFLAQNEETGSLIVEARAADQAFGISSARVMIFLPLPSGNITVFDGLTDISGSSAAVVLPAPPRSISQQADNGGKSPFALYSVYVEHPSFVRAIFTNVPVFSGVQSIQPVGMISKVTGATGAQEPEPVVVDESERNSL